MRRLNTMAIGLAMALSVLPVAASAFDPTDPLDGARDGDGDGLSNYQEFLHGTDPSNPDSDGGGAPDGWEVHYGLDPTNRADDYADTDGDGWDNYHEYLAGTDPLNKDTDGDGLIDSVDPNPLTFDGTAPICLASPAVQDGCGGIGPGPGMPGPVDGSGGGPGQGSGQGSGGGQGQGQGQGNGQGQGAGQGAGQGQGNGQGSGQQGGQQNNPADSDGDGVLEAALSGSFAEPLPQAPRVVMPLLF